MSAAGSFRPLCAAVDWGTSSFRLWLLDADGAVLAERRSGEGLLLAAKTGFEPVLESHLAAVGAPSDLPAILCGMVGSRTGWREAPYMDAPAALESLIDAAATISSERRLIRVLPGIAQRGVAEPDVMRGEETQLLGLVGGGRRTGLVCLPGTHSKWVRLEDGTVESFSTFMTGEIFELLRSGSVLAQAVAGAKGVDPADPTFAAAVRMVLDEPGLLTNRLFQLRAGWLLANAAPAASLARLSGLLIGLEIAGAGERYGDLTGAVLVASGPITPLYEAALRVAGVTGVETVSAEACVRDGLLVAARRAAGEGAIG